MIIQTETFAHVSYSYQSNPDTYVERICTTNILTLYILLPDEIQFQLTPATITTYLDQWNACQIYIVNTKHPCMYDLKICLLPPGGWEMAYDFLSINQQLYDICLLRSGILIPQLYYMEKLYITFYFKISHSLTRICSDILLSQISYWHEISHEMNYMTLYSNSCTIELYNTIPFLSCPIKKLNYSAESPSYLLPIRQPSQPITLSFPFSMVFLQELTACSLCGRLLVKPEQYKWEQCCQSNRYEFYLWVRISLWELYGTDSLNEQEYSYHATLSRPVKQIADLQTEIESYQQNEGIMGTLSLKLLLSLS